MPRITYQEFNFRSDTLTLIDQVNDIIDDYKKQGYSLTLRQVYYQLVARGLIPNNDKQYKIIGNAVNAGRLAGLIDWDAIEDRTRYIRKNSHWDTPKDIIATAAVGYYRDHWVDMDAYVEVWVEKDALIGIVQKACSKWDVPNFSCRGYTSQSEMWRAARRFIDKQEKDKNNVLIHLGDHDPSGIDMTRDIQERLEFFGADVEVKRIALNRDQIDEYNPPPNPAKITDTRCRSYIKKYGKVSWELDALPPNVLEELIEIEIYSYIEEKEWNYVETEIRQHKEELRRVYQNWDKICKYKFMKEIAE
jgi:hypothetical protein